MKRRTFLKYLKGFVGLSALTGIYTWQIEPFWLEFVNYKSAKQFEQLQKVFAHAVKGKYGTVGVLGNHDYGLNWSENHVAHQVISILEQTGITILRNEKTTIEDLNLIGLDDFWGTNYNPSILSKINHQQANLVLCHNPDVMDKPVWNDYKSWVLSGHTHGGQCKPPFLPPPLLPVRNQRYTSGKFDFDDGRTLYINRALGHLWQVRFNVRPEITIFTLDKA